MTGSHAMCNVHVRQTGTIYASHNKTGWVSHKITSNMVSVGLVRKPNDGQ